jgi:uncharacterized membrane protein
MESEVSACCDRSEARRTQNLAPERPHDNDGPNGPPTIELLTHAEGRILLTGVALTVGFLAWLGFKVITSPAQSHALLLMSAMTAVFGRPAAITIGYSMRLPNPIIFGIPATVETAIVLVFYPLIAFSCQHLVAIKLLRNAFRRLVETAETHKTSIRRYGPIGLFFFVVLVPYGSLIGAVIGFLLRMPVWLNLTTVLVGTYVATFFWTVFLHHLQGYVNSCGPYATTILVIAVIVVAWAGRLMRRMTARKGCGS